MELSVIIVFVLIILDKKLGNFSWGVPLLVIICLSFLYYKTNKLERNLITPHNELILFKQLLEKQGFKHKEDIEMLQNQIEKNLIEEKNAILTSFNFISKVFFFLFWVPAGFLLNLFFSQQNEILYEKDLFLFIVSLLIIMITVIALLIMVMPIIRTSTYSNKKQIFLYLEDVKYYYAGCTLETNENSPSL